MPPARQSTARNVGRSRSESALPIQTGPGAGAAQLLKMEVLSESGPGGAELSEQHNVT